mmetsp:Transcript_12061/g.28266  ORF Transcript_12061/g.28266 Transcript_12061/m.28266 type:complete len:120 (-) Transcript_12061:155-514(-)
MQSRSTKVADLSLEASGCCVRCRVVAVTVAAQMGAGEGDAVSCSEVLVGDETGCISMTLVGDQVELLQPGRSFEAENCAVEVFQKSLRLSVGRWGRIAILQPGLTCDVNLQNNLSTEAL